tara:strand:+ start:4503 stop:5654 length:1152 start_codon:yes stop_codon:yes gene_type:complete
MASFYSLLSRLEGEQKLQGSLNKSLLGIDVAQESQDINEARSQYRTDVEEAEREMAKKANKRSKWGTVATIGSAMLNFTGVTGKIASTVIAGVASGLARDSVKPYADTISTKLPGGKFHEQARLDLSADITSTNNFIDDAREGQGLLNWTNALSDAYTTYQIGGAVEDFRSSKDIATPDEISTEKLSKGNPLEFGEVNVAGQGVGKESLYDYVPSGLDSSQYIAGFESFSADPYGDEGQVSIGYGTNTFNLGETVTSGTTAISQEDALKELNFRIKEDFEPTVINKVGGKELYASIPGPAKTAMLDLAYNAGPNDITDTLIENILKGNWEDAAKEYETLALFGKESKKKLPGLVNRRKRGAMLLRGLIQEESPTRISDFFRGN